MNILVVGGAGYIGSHCVRQLQKTIHRPVVLDNLVYGHKEALDPLVPLYVGDLGDKAFVASVLDKEKIDVVMHFAAYAFVWESVENPFKYYENNVVATLRLLEVMIEKGIKRFVFSSSCATYGIPQQLPIAETTPQNPINPYGQTKLDVENLLKALAHAHGLSFASFRYFNAAGAAPDGSIGEDHTPEPHLIPCILQAILGQRPFVPVCGVDYPTPDGTCLRDYIHVDDLADAHIRALDHLAAPGTQLFFNLGTGTPYSVKAVIQAAERVTGRKVPQVVHPRRAGDPPSLYADASHARKVLGWVPHYQTIDSIVKTAWAWHSQYPEGYRNRGV